MNERPFLLALAADPHCAPRPDDGERYFDRSLLKLKACAKKAQQEGAWMFGCLGDLVDESIDPEGQLQQVLGQFEPFEARLFTLGNHDLQALAQPRLCQALGLPETGYGAFSARGFRWVLLNTNHDRTGTPYHAQNLVWNDSWLGKAQLDWLQHELAAATEPVLVFAHARLDDLPGSDYGVKDAYKAQTLLIQSKKVAAVFQGHFHYGDVKTLGGIPFYTLPAVVEGPSRCVLFLVQLDATEKTVSVQVQEVVCAPQAVE